MFLPCLNLHLHGRLWQQFVVDAFSAVEQYRLDWIRGHQHIIRSDLYKNIRDSLQRGDTDPVNLGKKVILPATFTVIYESVLQGLTCNMSYHWPSLSLFDYDV